MKRFNSVCIILSARLANKVVSRVATEGANLQTSQQDAKQVTPSYHQNIKNPYFFTFFFDPMIWFCIRTKVTINVLRGSQ